MTGTPGTTRRPAIEALHLTVLAGFVVAQPLYDVLQRNAEFFVAYRATWRDVALVIGLASVIVPLALIGLVGAAGLFGRAARAWAVNILVACLTAVLALEILRHFADWPTALSFAAAGAAGIGFAWAYRRTHVLGTFLTMLGPAPLLFPVLFLMRPAIWALAVPRAVETDAAVTVERPVPIVLMVFDQLPLASLLGPDGQLDAQLYPGFAELAANATWFRAATATANSTQFSLPAILSGTNPRPGGLPTARYYPRTLFTMLARSYRFDVIEPITMLCPERLCGATGLAFAGRLVSYAGDLAVVLAHLVVPPRLSSGLPSLETKWNGFIQGQNWHSRWVGARDSDRREIARRFVESISADDPVNTLYFLHDLLPHEPFVYAPSGQMLGREDMPVGLGEGEIWGAEPWLVTESYRRHLLQVAYVDSIVRQVIGRLRAIGRFDDALIVVTADHGAAFEPGLPFKGISSETLHAIVSVPLFVKRPHQHEAAISDRNVEGIDVVPTIADVLGVRVPWTINGMSAFHTTAPARRGKRLFTGGRWLEYAPELLRDLNRTVARRIELFGAGPDFSSVPRTSPFREVIGRRTSEFTIESRKVQAGLDAPGALAFADVQPESGFVPAQLTGWIAGTSEPRVPLAVALNGTIAATTWTYGRRWWALLDLSAFRRGQNDLQVYIIEKRGPEPALRQVYALPHAPDLNLVTRDAANSGVGQSGLYDVETSGDHAFRWTNGSATLTVPLTTLRTPVALDVTLAMVGEPGRQLAIKYGPCVLFAAHVSPGRWDRSFDLRGCPRPSGAAVIEIGSDTTTPAGPGDTRRLGVAVQSVKLR